MTAPATVKKAAPNDYVVKDIGALGIRVDDAKAFPAALAQALAANRPAIIDVVTDIEALAPTAVA